MSKELRVNGLQQVPLPAHQRRRWGVVAALLFCGAIFAAGWVIYSKPAPPTVVPPLPAEIQERDVRQAVEDARKKVLEQPDSAEAWGFYGMVLAANLFDRESDRCFFEASRRAKEDPRWIYLRAVMALKRDPDAGMTLLRQAVEASDTTPESHSRMRLRLAEALLERRELTEAEAIFRDEWTAHPGDPRAALGLGMTAAARGGDENRKIAIDLLKIARQSPCARKTATLQLAAVVADHSVAEAYAKEGESLKGDQFWPDPLREQIESLQVGRRGREREISACETQGQYDQAAQLYLRQLEDQRTAEDCIGAGLNLARIRDYERALPLLREALQLEPNSSQAHYTLALVQFTRAERAWASSPGAEVAKDWFREAAEESRRAAELKPNHARAYLFWGSSLKYVGKPSDAIVPLQKGVECQPNEIDLRVALGEALSEVGKLDDAKTQLENAQKLDPMDPRPKRALERLMKK